LTTTGETNEQEQEVKGSCWCAADGVVGVYPLYYYQVDFLSSDLYSWGETNELKQEYRDPAGGLGTG
jgi:hypothetical protein